MADFGLAKPATGLGQSGKFTHVSRKDGKVFGSLAYLPDDFFDTYQFSLKTDTYSFGVVGYIAGIDNAALIFFKLIFIYLPIFNNNLCDYSY